MRRSFHNRAVINTFTRSFASRKSTPPSAPPSTPSSTLAKSKSLEHSDLASFLAHAKRTGLDEASTTFTGTRYEYLVAERLARYGFSLTRVGGASDLGIDLLGHWTVPSTATTLRVLVQCKAGSRAGPHFIRELEGSFAGAPPGWRGPAVLALLVTERQTTKGVRDALARSRAAMAYVCCTAEGVVRQMQWNQRADDEGLEGVGVALRRGDDEEIVLVKDGLPLPVVM